MLQEEEEKYGGKGRDGKTQKRGNVYGQNESETEQTQICQYDNNFLHINEAKAGTQEVEAMVVCEQRYALRDCKFSRL